jgi:hypothetical protein
MVRRKGCWPCAVGEEVLGRWEAGWAALAVPLGREEEEEWATKNERRKRMVGWLGKKGKRIFPFKNLGILGWKFYGDLRGTQGEYWRREREK